MKVMGIMNVSYTFLPTQKILHGIISRNNKMLTFSEIPHWGKDFWFLLTRRTFIEFQISSAKLQKKIEICNLFPLKMGVLNRLKLN